MKKFFATVLTSAMVIVFFANVASADAWKTTFTQKAENTPNGYKQTIRVKQDCSGPSTKDIGRAALATIAIGTSFAVLDAVTGGQGNVGYVSGGYVGSRYYAGPDCRQVIVQPMNGYITGPSVIYR